MNPLEASIFRTVLYADIFDFPMTVYEIHHFLIHDRPVSFEEVAGTLDASSYLKTHLVQRHNYIAYSGRQHIIDLRLERERLAALLWPSAIRCGQWLARLPFVRMVALTGAMAMRNISPDGDFDYLLVTKPGRVWLARAFAILLVRIGKYRGVTICPNYIVADNALEQSRKDLFIAHELAQMVPLYGRELYLKMRALNQWSHVHMPNARVSFYDESEAPMGMVWGWFKRFLEAVLGGWLGNAFEAWEHRRKVRRFADKLHAPHSSAQVDLTQVKGHFNDHGQKIIAKYQARLDDCGLIAVSAPGD